MSKKLLVVSSLLVLVFAIAVPVYAQTPSPTVPQDNQSFFGEIATFFGGLFHHQNGQNLNSLQGQTQSGPMEGGEHITNAPSGTAMMPRPSGQPSSMLIQQYRLALLVKEGKITQTQEQQILAELTSVQSQLESWAKANGIDPSYVIGGQIMETGRDTSFQSHTSTQEGQMHPMIRYQSSYGQGSQHGEPQGGFSQHPPQ